MSKGGWSWADVKDYVPPPPKPTRAELEATIEDLRAELAQAKQLRGVANDVSRRDLDRLAAEHAALMEERDQLSRELNQAKADLLETQKRRAPTDNRPHAMRDWDIRPFLPREVKAWLERHPLGAEVPIPAVAAAQIITAIYRDDIAAHGEQADVAA